MHHINGTFLFLQSPNLLRFGDYSKQKVPNKEKHGPQPKADDNKPKKLTEKLTAPLKMESVTIIFSMFRLVTVEIFSSGVR